MWAFCLSNNWAQQSKGPMSAITFTIYLTWPHACWLASPSDTFSFYSPSLYVLVPAGISKSQMYLADRSRQIFRLLLVDSYCLSYYLHDCVLCWTRILEKVCVCLLSPSIDASPSSLFVCWHLRCYFRCTERLQLFATCERYAEREIWYFGGTNIKRKVCRLSPCTSGNSLSNEHHTLQDIDWILQVLITSEIQL